MKLYSARQGRAMKGRIQELNLLIRVLHVPWTKFCRRFSAGKEWQNTRTKMPVRVHTVDEVCQILFGAATVV